jgi:hypothetical protein
MEQNMRGTEEPRAKGRNRAHHETTRRRNAFAREIEAEGAPDEIE